jgi:hypothetical protein
MEEESRFDGKWMLITNTNFLTDQAAIKYKELRQVEQVFRGETRNNRNNRLSGTYVVMYSI